MHTNTNPTDRADYIPPRWTPDPDTYPAPAPASSGSNLKVLAAVGWIIVVLVVGGLVTGRIATPTADAAFNLAADRPGPEFDSGSTSSGLESSAVFTETYDAICELYLVGFSHEEVVDVVAYMSTTIDVRTQAEEDAVLQFLGEAIWQAERDCA